MTLLTTFKILLYRYSGQEDLCVGSPVSGRHHQETEGLIGFFVNTLALRTDLSGNPAFRELLLRVRETTLSGYDHQGVPFSKIVETVMEDRDMSRSPVFQVMFAMQQEGGPMELEGLSVLPEPAGSERVKFELTLTVTDRGNGLVCYLSYSRSLYEAATMQRMLGHYEQLLSSIVSDPETQIGDLQILHEQETQLLLNEFSGAEVNYPRSKTMVDLLEAQALRTPESIAVVCGTEQINYKTLRERSNQLAHYLRACDVTEDSLVCICMNRSIDMIVGMMGILKAGGAYVPIDPEYPQERISYLLNDTAASIVISETDLKEIIPADYTGQVLLLDALFTELEQQPLSAPVTALQPHHLAYIIYTSGSTGKPKGVMVEHRNVVRLFETDQPLYDFTERDVWTLFHSFSFDFSVWEMYGALLYGGRLVIVPRDVCRDTELFAALLIREGVTVLNQTPSAFYVLQDHLTSRPAALQLRYVIFGGESLELSRVERWQRYYPSCRLINMYGITETTVHVTYQEIGAAEVLRGGSLIGRPIPTLQCYILDGQQRLQPVGVAGEIYVGGAGVARGYWHRPELTAARFLPDVFGKEPGGRLYRSGDLGRWLADGRLEYLGRADGQVKIRGYRIELGEIESVTEQSGLVRQCVVAAQEDGAGNNRLVGYVVPNESFDRAQLQQYLLARLPAHMIPAIWIELEALPLTGNGKVDKSVLPAAGADSLQEKAYEAPRNELEQRMAQIWQQLLGVERVGIHDNFFSLGGHSLLVFPLVNNLRKLGCSLHFKDLFHHQTIESLSAHLSGAMQDPGSNHTGISHHHIQLLNAGNAQQPVFILPGSPGLTDAYEELARAFGHEYRVYGVQWMGLREGEQPLSKLEDNAACCKKWIREIQAAGPYRFVAHSIGAQLAFEISRQLEEEGKTVDFLTILDASVNTSRITYMNQGKTVDEGLTELAGSLLSTYGLPPLSAGWIRELENSLHASAEEDKPAAMLAFLDAKMGENENKAFILRAFYTTILQSLMIYYPPGKINARILVIKSEDGWAGMQECLGWEAWAANVQAVRTPGGHMSLIYDSNAAQVMLRIKTYLLA